MSNKRSKLDQKTQNIRRLREYSERRQANLEFQRLMSAPPPLFHPQGPSPPHYAPSHHLNPPTYSSNPWPPSPQFYLPDGYNAPPPFPQFYQPGGYHAPPPPSQFYQPGGYHAPHPPPQFYQPSGYQAPPQININGTGTTGTVKINCGPTININCGPTIFEPPISDNVNPPINANNPPGDVLLGSMTVEGGENERGDVAEAKNEVDIDLVNSNKALASRVTELEKANGDLMKTVESNSIQLETVKECPQCMDREKNKQTVPCYHPFCEECLREMIGQPCPKCRKVIDDMVDYCL